MISLKLSKHREKKLWTNINFLSEFFVQCAHSSLSLSLSRCYGTYIMKIVANTGFPIERNTVVTSAVTRQLPPRTMFCCFTCIVADLLVSMVLLLWYSWKHHRRLTITYLSGKWEPKTLRTKIVLTRFQDSGREKLKYETSLNTNIQIE